MRIIYSISFAMLLFAGHAAMAQTAAPAPPAPAMSKAALRHQDRAECNKEAARLAVPKSEMARFVGRCMAERQTERKKAAK
jgi:hypothetical protein